jgi:hypothetical protein
MTDRKKMDKKQFSNTKSIVKVEIGIVTLISYRHYWKIVGNNKLWPDMQKESWNNENFNLLPYLSFRKAVNFKSLFFQSLRCCTKNLSEKILINMIFRKIMPVAIDRNMSVMCLWGRYPIRHYLKIVGNISYDQICKKKVEITKILICSHTLNGTDS